MGHHRHDLYDDVLRGVREALAAAAAWHNQIERDGDENRLAAARAVYGLLSDAQDAAGQARP